MILDKNDPTKVVARANEALLIAEHPFETVGPPAIRPKPRGSFSPTGYSGSVLTSSRWSH